MCKLYHSSEVPLILWAFGKDKEEDKETRECKSLFKNLKFFLSCEDFDVREFAISVAGRLSEKNPAYVLPALCRHLIQFLMHLEQRGFGKIYGVRSAC
ncbi:uncharacterized protein LOC131251419 [Magnolia sinica]|uniref:uncharacterized protein LOC131251419 n=1 Tax=Magnolia sinica TaxID=86752 RepID=UPI002658796A|nr:uncharacterized protein LOC131251419 [Magnolia sinica]